MPRESPISPRIVLISFRDFLPKFFVLSSSDSVFWTRSAMVRMLAVLRQLDARTESSSSSTLRKRCSFSSTRAAGSVPAPACRSPSSAPARRPIARPLLPLRFLGHRRREVGEQVELILEDARGLPDRDVGRDAAVGPHLENQALLPFSRAARRLHLHDRSGEHT